MRVTRMVALVMGLLVLTASGTWAQTSVTGSERLGWDQAASDVGVLGWLVSIDGGPGVALADVTCEAAGPGAYTCAAAFPALTPGVHELRVAAYEDVGTTRLQSEWSVPLAVRLVVVPAVPTALRVVPGT